MVAKTIEGLLSQARVVGRETGFRSVAFVPDADSSPTDRWDALRNSIGAQYLPATAGAAGAVEDFVKDTKVGVWMMPDNLRAGTLETFLADIRRDDAPQPYLWEKSRDTVLSLEHRLFAEKDTAKAELRTWLAWQKEPGASPGLAVTMDCFNLSHPLAISLADWFRRLLPPTTPITP